MIVISCLCDVCNYFLHCIAYMYVNVALLITFIVNEYERTIVSHESTRDCMIVKMYIVIVIVTY